MLSIPYVCVLAAAGVCDHVMWSSVLEWIRMKGQSVKCRMLMRSIIYMHICIVEFYKLLFKPGACLVTEIVFIKVCVCTCTCVPIFVCSYAST